MLAALTGCRADDPGCSAAGCLSGVVVDLSAVPGGFGSTATVCIDSVCTNPEFVAGATIGGTFPDTWASEGKPTVSAPAPSSRVTTVRVTVTNDAGEVVVDEVIEARLAEFSPNGPDCPPTCWYVFITYDPTERRLLAQHPGDAVAGVTGR